MSNVCESGACYRKQWNQSEHTFLIAMVGFQAATQQDVCCETKSLVSGALVVTLNRRFDVVEFYS